MGTSTLQVLLASAYGTLRYLVQGNVDFILVLFMLIGSMIGVSIGAKIAKMINAVNTRKYFSALLIFALLLIAYDTLRRLW